MTVTISDGTLTDDGSFTWVISNGGIALTSPGDQDSQEDDVISLGISASDPGSTVTFAALNLPDGLSIDPDTGAISGTLERHRGGYRVRRLFRGDHGRRRHRRNRQHQFQLRTSRGRSGPPFWMPVTTRAAPNSTTSHCQSARRMPTATL